MLRSNTSATATVSTTSISSPIIVASLEPMSSLTSGLTLGGPVSRQPPPARSSAPSDWAAAMTPRSINGEPPAKSCKRSTVLASTSPPPSTAPISSAVWSRVKRARSTRKKRPVLPRSRDGVGKVVIRAGRSRSAAPSRRPRPAAPEAPIASPVGERRRRRGSGRGYSASTWWAAASIAAGSFATSTGSSRQNAPSGVPRPVCVPSTKRVVAPPRGVDRPYQLPRNGGLAYPASPTSTTPRCSESALSAAAHRRITSSLATIGHPATSAAFPIRASSTRAPAGAILRARQGKWPTLP